MAQSTKRGRNHEDQRHDQEGGDGHEGSGQEGSHQGVRLHRHASCRRFGDGRQEGPGIDEEGRRRDEEGHGRREEGHGRDEEGHGRDEEGHGRDIAACAADRRDEVHALELLMADHREVEQLFVRFEKAGKGARKQRQQLVERMTVALSQHAAIEENVLYPASRREQPTTNDDVLEALEEHHLVKLTLAELEMMDPSSERYDAKVTVLIESVRHHVKEEEKELFPQLRRSLGRDRLREIGAELVAAKRSAPTRPHPEAPDTPPTSIVVQAVTAPFDAAADLAGATAKRVPRSGDVTRSSDH